MRLLRGVGGHVLPCGCLVGVYETYEGNVVTTVDARGPGCTDPEHVLHAVLPAVETASVGQSLPPRRR